MRKINGIIIFFLICLPMKVCPFHHSGEYLEFYSKILNKLFPIPILDQKNDGELRIWIRAKYVFENKLWLSEFTEYKDGKIKVKLRILPLNLENTLEEYKRYGIENLDTIIYQLSLQIKEYEIYEKECNKLRKILKKIKGMRFHNPSEFLNYIALDYNEYEIVIQSNYEKSYNKIIIKENEIDFFEEIFNNLKECINMDLNEIGVKEFNYDSNFPVPISFLQNIKKVSARDYISLALDYDGNVWIWGCYDIEKANKENFIPQKHKYLKNIIDLEAYGRFALFLNDNNRLYALFFKDNYLEEHPIEVKNQVGIKMFDASRNRIIILDSDGNAYETDVKDDLISKEFSKISYIKNIKQISAGNYHFLALDYNGTVYSWGENNFGQLGIGNYKESGIPIRVKTKGKVKKILARENSSFALLEEGSIMAWGMNIGGQLGIGNIKNKNKPTFVKSLKNVKEIFRGNDHFFALTIDGKIFSWGFGLCGQLGNGKWENSSFPVEVLTKDKIIMMTGGLCHSLALLEDGRVFGWGCNSCGQIAK